MRTYCGSRPTMDIKHYFKYGLIVVASVTCCLELLLLPRHLLRKARHYVDDSSQNLFTFPLAHCPCSRTLPRPQNASTVPFNATTCSRDAFVRGDGQQVVSFSFYGDVHTKVAVQKGYFEGIRGNLDLMAQFYPNWIMRVYFDLATNDPVLSDLCDLACQYEVLDICHVAQLPGAPMVDARQVFAMNWRFFPTLDPQLSHPYMSVFRPAGKVRSNWEDPPVSTHKTSSELAQSGKMVSSKSALSYLLLTNVSLIYGLGLLKPGLIKSDPDPCLEPKQDKVCPEKGIHFYFDNQTQTCEQYKNETCGDSVNTFKTMSICREICHPHLNATLPITLVDSSPGKTNCSVPAKKQGIDCGVYQSNPRWTFDPNLGRCVLHPFGGCREADRWFATKEECHETCPQASDAILEWDRPLFCYGQPFVPGEIVTCQENENVFFYDFETGQCQPYLYGGCSGPQTQNFFQTVEECEKMCDLVRRPVDLYASRDLDSRFSLREQAAVQEWLDSDEPMHIMRDHPRHKIEILGAAWGTHLKRKNARGRWIKSWIKILNDTEAWASRQSKGPDQVILRRYVWPWARRSSIQHDSYFCRDYRGTIPFPTEREMSVNNFVAAAVKSNGTLVKKCPKKCRPEAHPDWEFC
ncbi:hypothetical protein TCAL_05108, partial [Tigriopus californicus]|eukprot:TCALIF_05108-PA protein Name:"Similar to Carboxypeptidase inhibitor SmCI (Sabellastarte magnifica)" AED:0.09 eAED:0.13 QI:5/0.5/0.2/1/0.25/0.4/5/0/634